jgi:hypothetical protein
MCLARRGNNSGGSSSGSLGNDWMLITASTDGLLCHWDLENLTEPVSSTVISSNIILPSIGGLSATGTEIASTSNLSSSQSSEDLSSKGSSNGLERPISVSAMALGPDEDERKVRFIEEIII